MTGGNEGDYCTVCGGIKPEAIKTRTILVDGKATGINQLDVIIDGVRKLRLDDDTAVRAELATTAPYAAGSSPKRSRRGRSS